LATFIDHRQYPYRRKEESAPISKVPAGGRDVVTLKSQN